MITVLVLTSLVIAHLSWQWYWRLQCQAPGSMGWPFIGETLQFVMDIRGFIRAHHARYGTVFRTHLFGSPTVFVSSMSDAKLVFLGEGKTVDMQLIQPVHQLMEGSLLTEHGDVHKEHRRLFCSMTKPDALKAVTKIAVPLIRKELSLWPSGSNIDIMPRIRRIVFTLSQIAVLGEYSDAFRDKIEHHFMTFNKGMFALPLDLPGTKFRKALQARKNLRVIFAQEIKRRREIGCGTGLLSVFLNDGTMTDDQIVSQTILALLAGFETTSFTIIIMAHTLVKQPQVVSQLREEQEASPSTDYFALQQQVLLIAAVKECMRLFPTVPISGRMVRTPFFTTTGIQIPAKWRILVGLDALSTMFSQQDGRFSLDRWQSKSTEPAKWEVASFGAGPRDCVGADLGRLFVKLVVHEMLRMFDWSLPKDCPVSKHALVVNLKSRLEGH